MKEKISKTLTKGLRIVIILNTIAFALTIYGVEFDYAYTLFRLSDNDQKAVSLLVSDY
jgi:hypothetical protein